jgi:predicted nucleic acid-binding protein
MIYVLDASVALQWYLPGAGEARADRVLRLLLHHPQRFALPELFLYEVLAVLYRQHPRAREIVARQVDRIARSGVLRYPLTPGLAGRIPRFVGKGLTGCDAVYAALAQELGGIWLTFDSRAHELIADDRVSADLNRQEIPD